MIQYLWSKQPWNNEIESVRGLLYERRIQIYQSNLAFYNKYLSHLVVLYLIL